MSQAQMIDHYLRDPKSVLAIAIAGIVLAISWLVFGSGGKSRAGISGRGGRGTPSVVLVGPSDGGKTSIFAQLIYSLSPPTHPSLTPSTASYTASSSSTSIKLTDLPGHPRLKERQKPYLKNDGLRGVVFVVDVGGLLRASGGSGIAEQLLPIMSTLAARSLSASANTFDDPPKLLILAHKADTLRSSTITGSVSGSSPSALTTVDEKTLQASIERTKTVLTREMTKLKSARSTPRGKIEGMSAVPRGSSGSSGGLFGTLRGLFGLRGAASGHDVVTSADTAEEDERKEEDAEQMIWGNDVAGAFRWEDVDGVEISWGASWVVPTATGAETKPGGEADGLGMLTDWLDAL